MKYLKAIDGYLHTFFKILMWRNFYFFFAVILQLYFLVFSTPFYLVLRTDAFYYVLKGMELTQGDFELFRPQAIGWPLFLSFFYTLLGTENIFEGMFLARWLSILLTSCSLLLTGLLCRKVCRNVPYEGACIVVVTFFALSFQIIGIGRVAYTEPLFLVLTLACYYFLVSQTRLGNRDIFLASLFAGLSYWVRANGVFQLAVILGVIVIWSDRDIRYILRKWVLSVAVFFVVSAPHMVLRLIQFGSPFDYGPNSKYFVDTYVQAWDDSVPMVTLWQYLMTHNWHDYYARFIEQGLFKVFRVLPVLFTHYSLWALLLAVFALYVIGRKRRDLYPFVFMFVVTIAGFSLVFMVFGHLRHVLFLIPFILVCSVRPLCAPLIQKLNLVNILFACLLVYAVVSFEKIDIYEGDHVRVPQVRDQWALWAADNLEGNVALVSGGDILRMAQHYKKPTADLVPLPFAEVEERITRIRPGNHASLTDALKYFQERDVRYLITNKLNVYNAHRRPYLWELQKPEWVHTFEHLQSFTGRDTGSALIGVDVYKVHYDGLPDISLKNKHE